jgi:cytochrome c
MTSIARVAALAALASAVAASAYAAQPGETLFQQRCAMCHALTPAPGKMGPPLKGVVGRKAGTAPGYVYSDALKASKLTWTPANLDKWLSGPMKLVPGTKMMIAVPAAEDRQAVIGYLASAK